MTSTSSRSVRRRTSGRWCGVTTSGRVRVCSTRRGCVWAASAWCTTACALCALLSWLLNLRGSTSLFCHIFLFLFECIFGSFRHFHDIYVYEISEIYDLDLKRYSANVLGKWQMLCVNERHENSLAQILY